MSALTARQAGRIAELRLVGLAPPPAAAPPEIPTIAWSPQPGPQTLAYHSLADELYYGGSAGGGKSDLLLGLAATAHQKSIIFRREFPQLKDLIGRCREMAGERGQYNGTDHLLRLADGRVVEFGAVQYLETVRKYRGRPHDLKAFDELPEFTELQYRFLNGWRRTTRPGQRTRTVAAGNPPADAAGEWVLRHWAPWLDRQHPRPALPGELRWYAMLDGREIEREDGTAFRWHDQVLTPTSRTFIPARLVDNPLLMATGYETTLQALPEPLRSQLLNGDFFAGRLDDPAQAIPTEWVRLAQQRWRERGRPTYTAPDGRTLPAPLTAVGVDVARGGDDKTCLARRYANWYAPVETHPGKSTPDGPAGARLVVAALAEGGYANIDVIGVGASVYDQVVQASATATGINFSSATSYRDRSGRLSFVNVRAAAYWALREALDPATGDDIALPDDPELLADLCAVRWMLRVRGVQMEDKDEVKRRIGRSPDKGDAVVLASIVQQVPFAGEGWE